MKKEEIRRQVLGIVPEELTEFDKLESNNHSLFDKWSNDREGRECLYYYVSREKKYKKRAPLDEIVNSVMRYEDQGKFDRGDFKEVCEIANRDGDCGYVIVGRILENLTDARYINRKLGFR
ncbi:hypothetical protein AMET1_1553 [Methanonatronarchaeum thermophilum]|uniref:Uncharacterized protein n=1 Tax=Methanonatronarchaeum thermophilum TaxID=1927129 RepID=A0A1Y3GF02_9EURY|nr:hypothetical protein [Methanonatronarchaeum thermophilum]OUJ18045.1 hypothetical protein AMET1_1553 [Methanonatronarchaeum thermophilum]